MKIFLELFFTKIVEDKVQYYKDRIDITDKKSNPDDEVENLILSDTHKTPNFIKDEFIVHSTSWRYEENGSIILTYIIFSEYLDFSDEDINELDLNNLQIAIGSNFKKPRPIVITEKNVISHALRHLNFLINIEDGDKYSKILSPMIVSKLSQIGKSISGELT